MAKPEPKPELTDAERHQRFVNMAREVEASEDPNAFDQAFEGVAGPSDKKAKAADDE